MDLPKYLITGCQYKICDNYPDGPNLSPEEYFLEFPKKWDNIYAQNLSRLNSLGNSGEFNVGSLELFPFNYGEFFKDHGYSLIDSVGFTGGSRYTVVKNA
jgi:hypothetical protein